MTLHFVGDTLKNKIGNDDYPDDMRPYIDSLVVRLEERPKDSANIVIIDSVSPPNMLIFFMQLVSLIISANVVFSAFGLGQRRLGVC